LTLYLQEPALKLSASLSKKKIEISSVMALSMNYAVRMIEESDKIQFGWSTERDSNKRTALAVLLDGVPAFTIDGSRESSRRNGMNEWTRLTSFMKGVLFTTRCICKAINVLGMICGIPMGDFSTCIDFVIEAVLKITEMEEGNEDLNMDSYAMGKFHDEIKIIDPKKAKKLAKTVLRLTGVVIGIIVVSSICTIS